MKNEVYKNEAVLWQSNVLPFFIPLLIGVIFVFLALAASANSGRSLLISLTIIIPEIIVWLIASVGAFRFKKYANSIKNYPDGKGLNHIANALLLLVLYIVLLTTASSIVNLFADSKYLDIAVSLKNHVPILVILASVFFLLKGSAELNKIVKSNVWTKTRLLLLIGSSLLFFIIFSYVFYEARSNVITATGIPRFALPIQALLITYILPHVIVWFVGFKACVNLMNYASHAPGVIYKSLFKDLYRGILLAFICIFIAQFLIITATVTTRLNFALGLIYVVLILAIVGFVLILKGAKKLDKLEGNA